MPLFEEITPDSSALLAEIEEFRQFLSTSPRGERDEFLPFFRGRRQLCAYLATLSNSVRLGTHLRCELPLWGDFVCDLVAGNMDDAAFVLVEFEDASTNSLFQQKPGRRNSVWGRRVEQAVSQVTDWLFRVVSEGSSDQMERDFGVRRISVTGLIVVGRSTDVSGYDRLRLNWRSDNTIIGGSKLSIITYDDLLEWLDGRVALMRSQLP